MRNKMDKFVRLSLNTESTFASTFFGWLISVIKDNERN